MRMQDLIEKKKNGFFHTKEELKFIIDGAVSGSIPDYQLSAWLMAVCFRGMSDGELAHVTELMARSGDTVDLSSLGDRTVDKHSTGGVGDKTTLIIAPLVASLGGIVAKMSGRGLGFTGGTIDKLESIPNFRTELSDAAFLRILSEHGVCIAGQSGNLTPADKKLYALRDVTATVDSIPLIASSVMSKKLATGAKSIVLDVKTGNGAFMKDVESASLLAQKMIAAGRAHGRNVRAVLTNMNIPLGNAVGNALEVKEAVEVLRGGGPRDLREICLVLATHMLALSVGGDEAALRRLCESALRDGTALRKLADMVRAQGGDVSCISNPESLPTAGTVYEIRSKKNGFIASMDCAVIGKTATLLGAGRETKGDHIDMSAGIVLTKKTGDFVRRGETLAYLHTNRAERLGEAELTYLSALAFSDTPVEREPLVYKIIV
ncbi:MAG: thymidine phosphorylase [Clostridia bacterium]|nr:thymidine phosphorylase [Clostridia bacterium]